MREQEQIWTGIADKSLKDARRIEFTFVKGNAIYESAMRAGNVDDETYIRRRIASSKEKIVAVYDQDTGNIVCANRDLIWALDEMLRKWKGACFEVGFTVTT